MSCKQEGLFRRLEIFGAGVAGRDYWCERLIELLAAAPAFMVCELGCRSIAGELERDISCKEPSGGFAVAAFLFLATSSRRLPYAVIQCSKNRFLCCSVMAPSDRKLNFLTSCGPRPDC